MKKFSRTILLLFVAMLLSACQPSPDKPVVINKNSSNLTHAAEAAQETDTQQLSIKEKIGALDKMGYSSVQGKLKVVVEAAVTVPEVNKLPIINVKSGVFSQDTVDKYWKKLIGSTPMWEISQQPTKSDIQQMIINHKKYLSTHNKTEDIKSINDKIDELTEMYQNAPETAEVTTATSKLKEMVNWDPESGEIDTRFMGTSGYSVKNQADLKNKKCVSFSASNPWTGNEGSIKSDTLPATIRYETSTINNNYGITGSKIVNENTGLDDTAKKLLKTTPTEAKKEVENFLNKTGTPMKVYSMELINDANPSENKEAQHYAYEITCARVVDNNLPVSIDPGSGAKQIIPEGYSSKAEEPSYTTSWYYENMIFKLDDDGFFEIVWEAPLEILDTEVDDSKILSFDDIKSRFEKMMFVSYEPNIKEGYNMECDISDIRLEMMRVRKQNSDPNALEGMLVPVWNFYGKGLLYNSKGKLVYGIEESFLSINAINGSVIDTRVGY